MKKDGHKKAVYEKDRLALGIDLGGTSIRIATVALDGSIIKKVKEPTEDKPLEKLLGMLKNFDYDSIYGICIAVAGLIDRKHRRIIKSPNILSLESFDLVNIVKNETGVKNVILENDASAAALGERWSGAGKGIEDFVLFTLGTGIGGGIIYRGELMDVASEFGHMTVNVSGDTCMCGNVGCLELYASGRAILNNAIRAIENGIETELKRCCEGNFYRLRVEDIYRIALDGDAVAREVIKEAGRYLGVGITNIINIFSPKTIILAGGLTSMWNIYVQEAINEASKRTFDELFKDVNIIPAGLGDDAGIIGAARKVFLTLQSADV